MRECFLGIFEKKIYYIDIIQYTFLKSHMYYRQNIHGNEFLPGHYTDFT